MTDWSGTVCYDETDLEVLEESALAGAQATIYKAMQRSDTKKADLARKMERPRSFITRMLSGDHNLTVRTMARALLACGYEVNFDFSPIAWRWVRQPPQPVECGRVSEEGTLLPTNSGSWVEECPCCP